MKKAEKTATKKAEKTATKKPAAQKKKQKTNKGNVNVKISICPKAIVGILQDDTSQLSFPQAYQLLQAIEDIVSSDQKPKVIIDYQSRKSPCLDNPKHTWPESWEPKASQHIQIPRLTTEKSSLLIEYKPAASLKTGLDLLESLPDIPSLPPLQKTTAHAVTAQSKWLPQHNKTSKTVKNASRNLVKVSNLRKIDDIPIEISVIPGFRRLPIIYHDCYNLRFTKTMKGRDDLVMLPDKPACIYSLLEKEFSVLKAHRCRFVEWRATDIFNIYDLSDYIPDSVRKCDILNTARIMKIHFYETIPNWDIFDNVVLRPLRIQTTGSVVACKLALDGGWAVNLGGGFGYNTTRISKGLSVYDDVPVCLAIMSKLSNVEHILVINCDSFQSPKYQYVNGISCPVTIVDFYYDSINEPPVREPIFPFGSTANEKGLVKYVMYHGYKLDAIEPRQHMIYLTKVITMILTNTSVLSTAPKPSLCIYIAGTNVLRSNDSVGFTKEAVIERDRKVFQIVQDNYDIPIAVLLGGGYEIQDAETAAASIGQLCNIGLPNLKWYYRMTASLK